MVYRQHAHAAIIDLLGCAAVSVSTSDQKVGFHTGLHYIRKTKLLSYHIHYQITYKKLFDIIFAASYQIPGIASKTASHLPEDTTA